MGEGADAIVQNAAYWRDHADQLAAVLRQPRRNLRAIPDPSGGVPAQGPGFEVFGASYWAAHTAELANALRRVSGDDGPSSRPSGVGAAPAGVERLTYTVEEAAAMLGISRAFAYEAVGRGDIPHIRIGRRILVPRSALDRLLAEPES